MALPAIRSRRGPRRRRPEKARADKAYDFPELRAWLRGRGSSRASPAAASTLANAWAGTAGRSKERSAWLSGYRRLTIRYERHSHLFAAFLTLAAALTC